MTINLIESRRPWKPHIFLRDGQWHVALGSRAGHFSNFATARFAARILMYRQIGLETLAEIELAQCRKPRAA